MFYANSNMTKQAQLFYILHVMTNWQDVLRLYCTSNDECNLV